MTHLTMFASVAGNILQTWCSNAKQFLCTVSYILKKELNKSLYFMKNPAEEITFEGWNQWAIQSKNCSLVALGIKVLFACLLFDQDFLE